MRGDRARRGRGESEPWAVVGLGPGSGAEAVRRRYRKVVRELHPDLMISRGVPEEARRLAEQRLAAVTNAYGEIKQELKV